MEEDLNSIRKDLEKVDKASVADKLGSVLEDLKEMENFEKLVSNDIDAKNEGNILTFYIQVLYILLNLFFYFFRNI